MGWHHLLTNSGEIAIESQIPGTTKEVAMFCKPLNLPILLGTMFLIPSLVVGETTISLTGTPTGYTADTGGTFLVSSSPGQGTGTGTLQPFLRIHDANSDVEDGFNTATGNNLDTKSGQWTHTVQLQDMAVVTVNGVDYYEFVLDANQTGSESSPNHIISLNQVQIFQSSAPATDSGYSFTQNPAAGYDAVIAMTGSGFTEVFRMDSAGNIDTSPGVNRQIQVNAGSGSGSGDMFLYVSTAAFNGTGNYVTFYSHFGSPPGSSEQNDGFEEWGFRAAAAVSTPLPSSLALLGSGLASLAGVWSIRRRRAAGSQAKA